MLTFFSRQGLVLRKREKERRLLLRNSQAEVVMREREKERSLLLRNIQAEVVMRDREKGRGLLLRRSRLEGIKAAAAVAAAAVEPLGGEVGVGGVARAVGSAPSPEGAAPGETG